MRGGPHAGVCEQRRQERPQRGGRQRVPGQHLGQEQGKRVPAPAAPAAVGAEDPLAADRAAGRVGRIVAVQQAVPIQRLAVTAAGTALLLKGKSSAWRAASSPTKRNGGGVMGPVNAPSSDARRGFCDGPEDGGTQAREARAKGGRPGRHLDSTAIVNSPTFTRSIRLPNGPSYDGTAALNSYTRGRDLSGSLQGAGGIGGLLARTESGGSAIGGPLATAFYFADNVGNVTTLASTNGLVVARYLYEPFGNIIAMGGPLADRNLYRFSSKEWHENAGLVYYGYRFYEPSLQRWLNRDPIGERGGNNLYCSLRNNPMCYVDSFGQQIWVCTRRTSGPPFGGKGRHAYLWDDRSPLQTHSCGLESAYKHDGSTSEPDDNGPIGTNPAMVHYSLGRPKWRH